VYEDKFDPINQLIQLSVIPLITELIMKLHQGKYLRNVQTEIKRFQIGVASNNITGSRKAVYCY